MKIQSLIDQIENTNIGDEFTFKSGISGIDISKPIQINDLIFRKVGRFMSYCFQEDLPFEVSDRVEGIDIYAYKNGFTFLGILLFEFLLSEQPYLEILLQHPNSEIKQFFIYGYRENHERLSPFLKLKQKEIFESFEYYATQIVRYPFSEYTDSENLPTFRFGWNNYHDYLQKNYIEKADQVILTCSIIGLVRTAELFLNIGNKHNLINEICLENPLCGNGGVSENSIEARFWLPESFGFYTDKIDDLQF